MLRMRRFVDKIPTRIRRDLFLPEDAGDDVKVSRLSVPFISRTRFERCRMITNTATRIAQVDWCQSRVITGVAMARDKEATMELKETIRLVAKTRANTTSAIPA